MKLRDRRAKREVVHIKQEENRKSVLAMAESSAIAATDADTVEPTVKREDTKEEKLLLKRYDEFGNKDYYYRCDMCEMKMTDLKSVLEHRISIHIDKLYTSNRKIKNVDTEPDIHDHNFYCKSCERRYKDKQAYRQHLRQAHYMILKPILNWKAPRNGIVPDPDDPNLYCRACDRIYASDQYYKKHCRYSHGVKHVKVANQSSTTSSSLIDTYCQVCDKRFASLYSYRGHLFANHKVDWRTIQRKRKDILPNVNDLNFYCRSCEKKLVNKYSYKSHLMLVHSIFESAPRKKSKLKPDVNDPNNHCRACQNTYASKYAYRVHIRLVHHITLPPLRKNINRTDLPDPYNIDHYCSVCKTTYKSLTNYRRHCKVIHFMKLSHASIVDPNAKININGPDLYCAQCERTLATKDGYKRHLRRVHHQI
ncbi:hypothetical protein MBANPS3_010450 [Mucor bainieri]